MRWWESPPKFTDVAFNLEPDYMGMVVLCSKLIKEGHIFKQTGAIVDVLLMIICLNWNSEGIRSYSSYFCEGDHVKVSRLMTPRCLSAEENENFRDVHEYNIRERDAFRSAQHWLRDYKALPSEVGAKLFNKLPLDLHVENRKPLFKR
ncbi:hypothetical protein J6590_050580 [Homalodisca vitripennis]|nr:hypothetical protein J6590_050580 [Homalodisca vitripennis]